MLVPDKKYYIDCVTTRMSVYMMASFQRLVSSAGSNTVQYVLVGENGQITPLGQPVQTQVRPEKVKRGSQIKHGIFFLGEN